MELNLHEIFGHYHRCMIAFGLLPCSEKRLQQRIQKIYGILLAFSAVGISIYGIHDVHTSMDSQDDLMISFTIMTLCFISDASTLVVILFEMVIKYDHHVQFINKSQQIYWKFHHKADHKLFSGAFGAWLRRKYGCIAIVLGGGLVIYLLIAFSNFLYGFYCYLVLIILILRSRLLQMSLYVDIMHNYLQLLNKQLQKIIGINALHKSLIITHVEQSLLNNSQHLLMLKEIHWDIGQFVELYNEMFGWSIANIVVCCYLNITVHLYWCFMAFDGFYQLNVLYAASTVLIPLLTILNVFAYNCEQLQRSNSYTTSLVKKMIVIGNEDCKALSYEFLLQIFNKPMHVSAKGFFQVDLGMLMALGTYIASMMVILVQFSLAEFADRDYRSKKNMTN